MAQFETNVATTELEAVNRMMSAIGNADITQSELDTPTRDDTTKAIAIVRHTLRDILAEGWKFNTEWSFRIATAATKFAVPNDLIDFHVSHRPDQIGRRPIKNDDGTVPLTNLLDITTRDGFFYDRLRNANTWTGDFVRAQIFIDYVRLLDFEDIPQAARVMIVTRAGRTFAETMVGDKEVVGFTLDDEQAALRTLKRLEGNKRSYSIFDSATERRALGGRQRASRWS